MMRTVTALRWLIFGAFLLFSCGCALIAPSSTPPVEPVVATRVADATASPPTSTPLLATPTSLPTPTANPCPDPRDLEPPQRHQDLDAYMSALREYLGAGGDPVRVQLQEQEELQQGDLTGNGVPESVFILIDAEAQQIPPKAHFAIYTCGSGDITVLYHYDPGDWGGLELIGVTDLTEDGIADLIFSEVSCGAHTCWHTPQVWSWQGRDFENRMGEDYAFPYPWYTLENGTLVVVSHGMGSVGAGPQRTVTTTLAWAGAVITVTERTEAPPTYRYHAFVDGDRALTRGDFEAAEAAYRRVIEDASLELWGGFSSPEDEYDWLVALGRWRLITLHVHLGDPAEAEAHYGILQGENAPGTTAFSVVGLAERFWRAYQRNENLGNACEYVVGGTEAPLAADFLATFGYANPIYEARHLCPFTTSGVGDLPD
jgi:hypothetical protein